MNASEYINQLKQIDKDYSKEIGMDCLDDEMIENANSSTTNIVRMSFISDKEKIE